MKTFVISDTHFHHKNIIEYSKRPFKTIEEMDAEIIKRWNNKVSKEDLVIHLGDFGLGDNNQIKSTRDKLNGTIVLLRGNHDHKSVRNAGFIIIKGTLEIDNIVLSHNPLKKDEIPTGFVNVHGHIHDKESAIGINISVEHINYEPITLAQLKEMVASFINKPEI